MIRAIVVFSSLCVLAGCSDSQSTDPTSATGAFNQIVSGIADMHTDINSQYYQGDELGNDILGNTLIRWVESCKGTDLEADAGALLEKYLEVEQLTSHRASVDALKEKVQELQKLAGEIQKKV